MKREKGDGKREKFKTLFPFPFSFRRFYNDATIWDRRRARRSKYRIAAGASIQIGTGGNNLFRTTFRGQTANFNRARHANFRRNVRGVTCRGNLFSGRQRNLSGSSANAGSRLPCKKTSCGGRNCYQRVAQSFS